MKTNTGNAVSIRAREFLLGAHKCNDAAPAISIGDDSSVDCRTADVGIAAVDWLAIGSRPADDEGSVVDLLVTDSPGFQDMVAFTVGGASEGESAAVEGTAVGAIDTTGISCSPEGDSTSDVLGFTPSGNLSRNGALSLYEGKGNRPDDDIKGKEPDSMLPLWKESVNEVERVLLDDGEEWLDSVRLRIRRSLGPLADGLVDAARRVRHPFPLLPGALILYKSRCWRTTILIKSIERRIRMAGIGSVSRVHIVGVALVAADGDDVNVDGVSFYASHEGLCLCSFIMAHHGGLLIEGREKRRGVAWALVWTDDLLVPGDPSPMKRS